MVSTERPLKRVSYTEKIANDFAYCKKWIDYIQASARLHSTTYNTDSRDNFIELAYLYDIANGIIPKKWFANVVNPFNYKNEQLAMPAKIEDYNLIYTNFVYMLGQKEQRPFIYQVENMAADAGSQQLEQEHKMITTSLTEYFNGLLEQGNPEPKLEEELKKFGLSYKDNKALRGQKILNYIVQETSLKAKLVEDWQHWLTAGEAYMRLYIKEDKVNTLPISPLHLDYERQSQDYNSKYTQDSNWVIARYRWTPTQVIDYFYDELTGTQVEAIDNYNRSNNGNSWALYVSVFEPYNKDRRDNRVGEFLDVIHCQWRTLRKRGKFAYISPITFEEEILEVDESFKIPDGVEGTIDWEWVEDLWEGWKINDKEYLGIRRLLVQNGKLEYYGTNFSDLHSTNTSFVKLGLPYLKLFVVTWYRLEMAIARSMGSISMLPIQLFNGGEGKEEETFNKFIYTAQSLGIGLVDLSDDLIRNSGLNNLIGKADIGQLQDAKFYLELLERIKSLWDEHIGISKASKGQQLASQGVGSVQAELAQSLIITEHIHAKFERLEEKILQGILDLSQYAYVEGKNLTVIRDDNQVEYLEVDGYDHFNSDYGVFVMKSSKEIQRLEAMRAIAGQLATQNKSEELIAEIIYADNSAELKKVIYELKNKELQIAESQANSEAERQQNLLQTEQAFKEMEAEIEVNKEIRIADNKFLHDRELELIKLENNSLSFQGTTDSDANGIPDVNEVEKRSNERLKMSIDAKLKMAELAIKAKDSENKVKIAKTNKNKHDK